MWCSARDIIATLLDIIATGEMRNLAQSFPARSRRKQVTPRPLTGLDVALIDRLFLPAHHSHVVPGCLGRCRTSGAVESHLQSEHGFISYLRVSTTKQGKSGLGIEARRAAVANYLNGGNWNIIAEFTETEAGKRSDRPALDKALAAARLHRCPVVVANVSRLTRSMAFLSRLLLIST
jgi:Resolvase, N terminal domain